MVILNMGLLSSASTWVSNIVRKLMAEYTDKQLLIGFADSLTTFPNYNGQSDVNLLMKVHSPAKDLVILSATNASRTILTLRDPRDCIASLMQRFSRSFEQAYADTAISLAHLDSVSIEHALLLRYEDRFFEKTETIVEIAKFLGLRCTPEFAAQLAEQFSVEAVKKLTDNIPNMPAKTIRQRVDSIVHKSTGFHSNHITDTRSGKFRELLTPQQIHHIDATLGPSFARFGYVSEHDTIAPASFSATNLGSPKDGIIAVKSSLTGGCAVFGPYVTLAKGPWTASFVADADCPVDVAAGGETLATGNSKAPVDFEVKAVGAGVEFRVFATGRENTFRGVKLSRAS